MNKEQKNILDEYAKLKIEIKALEEKADELNPKVLEALRENDLGEVQVSDLGVLTVATRRTWKYSPTLKEEEAILKEKKKNEERLGLANYEEKSFVTFKGL
jgi:predicted phage-related endonuclease